MRKILSIPFYPILMAPVPLIALVVINIDQVNLWSGLRFFLLSVLAGVLVTGWFRLLLQDWNRAAFVTMLLIIFWNAWQYLDTFSRIIALVLIAALAVFVRPPKLNLVKANLGLNLLAIYLISISGGLALFRGAARDIPLTRIKAAQAFTIDETAPDLYLVIVDSYGGRSVLVDRFGYNNNPFLDQIAALGFKTGECPPLGPHTDVALASILNPTWERDEELWEQIRRSEVRATLELRGYQTVAYETGYVWDEWTDADLYLHPDHSAGLTELEALSVLITPLEEMDGVFFNGPGDMAKRARARTYLIFDSLAWSAFTEGPQFVFAHILQPHPPFVFAADGSELSGGIDFNQREYDAGYMGQLQYINTRLVAVLTQVVTQDPDSIVIVTGDHGPRYHEEQTGDPVLCAVHSPVVMPLQAGAALAEVIK